MKRNDFVEVLATIFACCMVIGILVTVWYGLLSGEKTEVFAAGSDLLSDPLQSYTIRSEKSEYVRIWTDPETGVQYLLYTALHSLH